MTEEIQRTMRAIEIRDGKLYETRRPVPTPGPGEVRIRVAAAGINRADLLQKQGKYPPPPGASDLPGLEVSGTVDSSGERVCALLPGGGYAEYAVVPRALCLPVPDSLPLPHAAALPEGIFTVWKNLFGLGGVKSGDTVLVHGGASGIGSTAIALCRSLDVEIVVTAGSAEKCAACLAWGAARAINYKDSDFVSEIMACTQGRGVDAVLDMIGGDYVSRNLAVLAFGGRHVSIAWQGGAKAQIPIPPVMQKNLTLTGSTLRDRPVAEKIALAQTIRARVWPHILEGRIRPRLCASLPLGQADEALDRLERGQAIGKIILEID